MADWWEAAPVVEQPSNDEWWNTAPVVQPVAEPGPQPEPRGILRRIDDGVRGLADVFTFGLSDEISAGMGALTGLGGQAGSYEANLDAQRTRDNEGGGERLAGQIGGALLSPAMLTKSLGGAALQGMGMGAAYGFGSGEGDFANRRDAALAGGALGAAGGAAGQSIANVLAQRAARASIPSAETLTALGRASYDAADSAGVVIKPEGIKRLAASVQDDLAEFGYHPALQPRVGTVINELGRLSEGNVTFGGLDTLRKIVSSAGSSTDASERALAAKIINRIDDYATNIPADDLITGNADQASKAIKTARDYWSRAKKEERIQQALYGADLRSGATGSGANIDNATRQRIASLLLSQKGSRGFTAAEKEAAEQVARGTPTQNAMRLLGKLAPTGVVSGGIGTSLGASIGNAIGGPALATVGAFAVPAAGASAKRVADAMTQRSAGALSEIIRSGGKNAAQIADEAAEGIGSRELVDAILRLQLNSARARPTISLAPGIGYEAVSANR